MQEQIKYHLDFAEEIISFSNILYENFQITYFHFVRIYDDNTRISLTNYKEWMKFYYEKELYKTPTFPKSFELTESKNCLWISMKDDKNLSVLSEEFEVENGVTLIEKFKDYCEYCYFGTDKNNFNIYNICMNNKTVFKDFITFFKLEAKKIIRKCELNKISKLQEVLSSPINSNYSIAIKDFFENINKKNYSLFIDDNIRITIRELECIIWCMKGKTADETGLILKISRRAVEQYIQNLKEKFNCYKTPELIYKLIKCGISIDNYLDYFSNKK